jgi:hypothetical protein
MTDGPYKLPSSWGWGKLGEVCEVFQGKTPAKSDYVNEPTQFKVLKFRDVTLSGTIDWSEIDRGFVAVAKNWRLGQPGDVLITASAHTPEQIGRKVSLLPEIPPQYSSIVITGELMVARPKKDMILPLWVRYWLALYRGLCRSNQK